MARKKYIIGMFLTILGLATAISITVAPSLMAHEEHRRQIPFDGMTLSYQSYWTWAPPGSSPLVSRMITFYGDPSEPDYIWVRDSENIPDTLSDDTVFKIDVTTRKIVGQEGYTQALFPTDLHVGDELIAQWGGPITIIGSQTMSVMGKQVDAWIAYAEGSWGWYTQYYEKKTGISLGGTHVWYEGDTLNSWVMYLVSTNAPLFEED